ncbi:metallophosphoesterase [uncultured Sphaerochaeta sp.]|uniref:metallophosphoesterase family protein n=1 Tax=uncultured Sphaerochaeta sp. TaxID=886478 RepID=UPI002A0A6325|nr:metallophosphoesterase [uncultured Sphaerochaeta sp.]
MEKHKHKPLLKIVDSIMTLLSFAGLGLVLWIALEKRNLALFAWNPMFRNFYLGLVILAIVIPVLVFLDLRRHKKREQKTSLGLVSYILVILGLALALGIPAAEGTFSTHADKAPQLMLLGKSDTQGNPELALVWYTKKPEKGKVFYGLSAEHLEYSVEEEKPMQSHGLILSALQRGKTYYYSSSETPEVRSFRYFPQYDGGLRLAISSDAHVGAETNDLGATVDILRQVVDPKNDYSLICNLGDVVELGNKDSQIAAQVELFSHFTDSLPLIQVLGNHDGWFGGYANWAQTYYPKSLQEEAQLYHRFDITDSIHIITLDLEWGTESYDAKQKAWLLKQLDSLDPNDVIIIMDHAYFFGSSTEYQGVPWYDNQQMITTFHQLFVDHGVDLVFSGHDHQFEHILQDGVNYFIVGTFGGKFDDSPTYISPGSIFRDFSHHGYADVLVKEHEVSVTFRQPDGTALYSWGKNL